MHPVVWKLSTCAVLLFLVNIPTSESRNVTHEDIRDAMLSLIHMFRTSEDKLERHEYREKALGEQLKKSLGALEKKHRALEPLKGTLARLDERLSNVETILMQKEEREKKTNDALAAIQGSLQSLNTLLRGSNGAAPSGGATVALSEHDLDAYKKLDDIQADVTKIKEGIAKSCTEHGVMSETEKLLNKYETRLSEMSNGSRVPTDFVQLSEITLSDEAWHSKMTEVMEKQEKGIEKIHKVLSDAEGVWKGLSTREDVESVANRTVGAVHEVSYNIISSQEKASTQLEGKLANMNEQTKTVNEDIQKSLTDGNTMTEKMYADIAKSYEQLRGEVQGLSNVERVMLQTADNVLENRKRIEYSVHQISNDVGELVRAHTGSLNRTVHNRFDNIEATILDTQTGALANLTAKIETEMSQVWRQIGIMYNQLTASKMSLDRLEKQTETYVNGSATTMDSMENKVGLITSRMGEVDENLNYLLGRLSLVTNEFNRIKVGLGDALDDIKTSFLAVKKQLKDVGPGPHKIEKEEEDEVATV